MADVSGFHALIVIAIILVNLAVLFLVVWFAVRLALRQSNRRERRSSVDGHDSVR